MEKHIAYNLTTGEILATNRSNHLKHCLARNIANDRKWVEAHGQNCPPNCWVFAHGKDVTDCIAKLAARKAWVDAHAVPGRRSQKVHKIIFQKRVDKVFIP